MVGPGLFVDSLEKVSMKSFAVFNYDFRFVGIVEARDGLDAVKRVKDSQRFRFVFGPMVEEVYWANGEWNRAYQGY